MKLLNICVGKPKEVEWQGKFISSGIWKEPIQGPVKASRTGLEGDGQADLNVHGGIEKAVYAYSFHNYNWWQKTIDKEIPNHKEGKLKPGAFGENLVVDKFDEKQIFIGDVFQVGEAQLEVSEPRFPCFKLGIKFGEPKIIKLFLESELSGIYFRVLKEGVLQAGDKLKLIKSEAVKVSIHEMVSFYRTKDMAPARAAEILKLKSLGPRWREKFEKIDRRN